LLHAAPTWAMRRLDSNKKAARGPPLSARCHLRLLPGGCRHHVRRAVHRGLRRGAQFLPALLVRVIARVDDDDFLLLDRDEVSLLGELLADVGRLSLEDGWDGLVAQRCFLPIEIGFALVERRA